MESSQETAVQKTFANRLIPNQLIENEQFDAKNTKTEISSKSL